MKKAIQLFAICSLTLLFSRCSKHCPGFTEEDWFPYTVDQKLNFIGDTTFCMYVNTYDASEEYSLDNSCNCECTNSLYLVINSVDTTTSCCISAYVFANSYDINNIPDIRIELYLRGIFDYFYAGPDRTNYTFYDSLNVNGTIFSDAVLINRSQSDDLIETDDTEIDFIQIILAKNYGIVSVMDSDSNSYYLQ